LGHVTLFQGDLLGLQPQKREILEPRVPKRAETKIYNFTHMLFRDWHVKTRQSRTIFNLILLAASMKYCGNSYTDETTPKKANLSVERRDYTFWIWRYLRRAILKLHEFWSKSNAQFISKINLPHITNESSAQF
jgi:hypothetical protein